MDNFYGGGGQITDANTIKKRMNPAGLISRATNQVKPTNQTASKQPTRYEGGAANNADYMSRMSEVNSLYKDFGWEGNQDNQGTQYWADRMKSGLSGDALRQEFQQAGESYLAKNPNAPGAAESRRQSNSNVLDSVYENTLGRKPDTQGKQFWMNEIDKGQTPEQVRQSIFDGAENQSLIRSAKQGEATTVQDRMEGLLSEGSRYLDIARQGAAEQANSRGFLNSTMAAGAGERAAIESALPIAQQDSQTLTNTSLQNASQTNQMRGQVLEEQMQRWSQTTRQAHDKTMSEMEYAQEQGIIDQKAYANLRGQYLDSITQLARERAISMNEIQTSQIPAEQKAVMMKNLDTMHELDLAGTSAIFAQMPMWQRNWSEAMGNSSGVDTGGWQYPDAVQLPSESDGTNSAPTTPAPSTPAPTSPAPANPAPSNPPQNQQSTTVDTITPDAPEAQIQTAVRSLYQEMGWDQYMQPDGIQFWVDQVRNGLTGSALRNEFTKAGNEYLASLNN